MTADEKKRNTLIDFHLTKVRIPDMTGLLVPFSLDSRLAASARAGTLRCKSWKDSLHQEVPVKEWDWETICTHQGVEMRSSSEEGSYLRLIDFCITQL